MRRLILLLSLLSVFFFSAAWAGGLDDFKKSVQRRSDRDQEEDKDEDDEDNDDESRYSSSESETGFFLYGDISCDVIHFGNPYLYGTVDGEVVVPGKGYVLSADLHSGFLEDDISEFGADLTIDFGGAGFELNSHYFIENLPAGETDTLFIGYINGFMGVGEYTFYSRFKFGITHIFGEGYTGGWNLGFEQAWYPGGNIHFSVDYEVSLLRESLLADFAIFLLGLDSEADQGYGSVGLLTRASVSVGYSVGPGELFAGYIHFLSSPQEGDPAEMFGLFGGLRFWI